MTPASAVAGATRAAAKASRVYPRWSDIAYAYLERFAASRGGVSFMTEDVRMRAEVAKAVPKAPDSRAWGAVILRAKREGRVIHAGYSANKDPSCHGSPKSRWSWV